MTTSVQFEAQESGANAPEVPATTTLEGDRPAWLPSNFKSPEELARSYAELQAQNTRVSQELSALKGSSKDEKPGAPNDPLKVPTPKPDDKAKTDDQQTQDAIKSTGFDVNPYSAEFETTGDVAPDNRAKIADGIKSLFNGDAELARRVVDQYVDGRKVSVENDRNLFMQEAGGEEQYANMVSWAAQSIPREDQASFNRTIESGDRSAILFAIAGLKARYQAANGIEPSVSYSGNRPLTPGGNKPYNSTAEMTADMRDPRYQTDPAFREMVKARLAAG